MAIILDTGVLYAYYDRRDDWHSASRKLIDSEVGNLIVPTPIIPEVDYLLGKRLGVEAQAVFYRSLVDKYFITKDVPLGGYSRIAELNFKGLHGFVWARSVGSP